MPIRRRDRNRSRLTPSLAFAAWLSLASIGLAQVPGGPAASPAATPAPATTPAANAPTAGVRIAAVDMEKAFAGYEKARFLKKQINDELSTRRAELIKIRTNLTTLAQQLQSLDPNGNDFRTKEAEATKLKVEYETSAQQIEADFIRKEADALGTLYKDLQEMTDRVSQHYGYDIVVKVTTTQPSSDPNSVMAALSTPVLYVKPSIDITNVVLANLNAQYKKQGGVVVPADAPQDPATVPTSATSAAPPAAAEATPAPAAAPAAARTATAPATTRAPR